VKASHLHFIGPITFLLIGIGFFVGAAIAPAGATTDDGFPLSWFLLGMGACFLPIGALWLVSAVFLARKQDEKEARESAKVAYLRAQGVRVTARVISSQKTGYISFKNEVWTNLTVEVALPGHPPREVHLHVALARRVLEAVENGSPIVLLVDPHNPSSVILAS
jgi:hypothetical protein